MPVDFAFAPYRLAPGADPEEAVRAAEEAAAEPLLAAAAEPLPGPFVARALADVPAGRAASPSEACRAADDLVAGGDDAPRACLTSPRQRARVAGASREALGAGFAGVCLAAPDAALALGLLGAGFCPDCQRDLARRLAREYGDHFQPIDYLALVKAEIADAPGAVSFSQLPFGRDFWRARNDALTRAIAEHARDARDAARAAGRPFEVVAQFEALGQAQLRAARHLDAAIFPAAASAGPAGIALARLLRGAMGRRACAIATGGGHPAAAGCVAAAAASCAIDLAGLEPSGDARRELAEVRRLARRLRANALSPLQTDPVAECAILYSTEADLWTGGLHGDAVVRAGEALARAHVQAPVVTRIRDAPPAATLVLADAVGLSALEASEARRRLEGGGTLLAFGEPAAVDELGHLAPPFLHGVRPGGTRAKEGLAATLPSLAPGSRPAAPPDAPLLDKALAALLGRGRRGTWVASPRVPVHVVLYRRNGGLVAHLVPDEGERVQGATLFLGAALGGGARRARFVSADGTDVRIPMNPSGSSLSTVLPAFERYAVLSLAA